MKLGQDKFSYYRLGLVFSGKDRFG